MPASESTRLAARPSFTARMSGMPPATAASNARVTPRRLAPLLVLDEREAHVALAVLAEPDARRHRDPRLLDAQLGELQRAHGPEWLGNRCPHEHRALGLGDLPAELVEAVHQHVAALAMDLDDLVHHLLVALEGDDARDLDRLEGAVVEVGLDARQRGDHARVPAHE